MSSGSEGQFALTPPASESSVLPSFAQMEGVTPHENIAGRPPQDVETRDLSGDPKSQQEGNCKAEVNSGCTAAPKEDTQHSKLRSEIINRLKKEKNCLESITDEDFKVWQEKAAHDLAGSDAIAIVPIEPETRQARINSINKLISGYRSGKKVYTFGDNAIMQLLVRPWERGILSKRSEKPSERGRRPVSSCSRRIQICKPRANAWRRRVRRISRHWPKASSTRLSR